MSAQKVILIGPMGAGKTTLGALISAELGWPYFDNDGELASLNDLTVEQLSALSVPELHALEGEYVQHVMQRPAPFIAGAAASVIDYPESVKLLREATSIYLRLPLEKLLERAGSTGIGRQALAENAQAVITERFMRRDPHYREVASYTCELGDDPQIDAAKIIDWLKLQTQIG
jgi:shikimate kinase